MFVNKFLQSCTILNTLKPFSIKSVNLKHTLRRLKMLFLEKSNVKDSDTLASTNKMLWILTCCIARKQRKTCQPLFPQAKEVHRTTIKTVKQSVQ